MDNVNLPFAWGVMINKPKRIGHAKDKSVCHPNMQKHDKCCHRLFDLCVIIDPWWCSKAFCHTEAWEGQVSGCISCEREFFKVGGKEFLKDGGRDVG